MYLFCFTCRPTKHRLLERNDKVSEKSSLGREKDGGFVDRASPLWLGVVDEERRLVTQGKNATEFDQEQRSQKRVAEFPPPIQEDLPVVVV